MASFLTRQLIRLGAGVFLLAIIVGLPAALIATIGDPLPTHPPTVDELARTLTGPFTDTMVLDLLAVAAWLLWAAFLHAVLGEARAAIRGIPARHAGRTAGPLRRVAATIITAVTLGTILTATSGLAQAAVVTTSGPAPATTPVAVAHVGVHQRGPVVVHVGASSYVYVVTRGDFMSAIAHAWLGDANRWPEICALNKHRHFPSVGGTLHDCNLIYPGWDLRLPADARPPANAQPTTPPPTPPATQPALHANPTPPSTTSATPHPGGGPFIAPPVTVTATPATPKPTTPEPTTPSTPTPTITTPRPSSSPATAGPAATPGASAPSGAAGTPGATSSTSERHSPTARPGADSHGVWLSDGSWLPWSLVAAIVAAAPLVWMWRSRRFDTDSDEQLIELPQPVIDLERALTRHPELAAPSSEQAQSGAAPPAPDLPPPGGIGLIGDGAHGAARAALIAALAVGGPNDPHACGEVVIDASTLATLIGADAVTLGPWPRLHICDDLDHALSSIHERLLHRSRLLDEHALTDLDVLRTQAPDEEALPPVLVICEPPPPDARMRARTSFSLGTALKVSALLLGEWDHGATVDVSLDGHTRLVAGTPTDTLPARMAVIDTDSAVQVLLTLREAHTGTPHPAAITAPPTPPPPGTPHEADDHSPDLGVGSAPAAGQSEPATHRPAGATQLPAKARVRVLGPPGIDNITEPGRPLRAKALELAVFLACHPEGVPTRGVGEYLEPEARVDPADQRVHTNASNLRHVLARVAGKRKDAYVIKTDGRYRLDPATVEVDLWHLQDLMRSVRLATGTRRRDILRAACDLVAPLAQGHDYDWITLHRQRVRRWGTEAHLLLADDIIADDPQAASDLLDKAITLDPHCEALYQRAMRARHALHDRDGIRILLRALAKATDIEPSDDTITLANTLRASLDQ